MATTDLLLAATIVAAGCGTSAQRPSWPTCIRAEFGDHASGIREFTFDAAGNPITIIDRDNRPGSHGEVLTHTAIAWTDTRVDERIVSSKMPMPEGHGTLGTHGELLTWSALTPPDAEGRAYGQQLELKWTGRFEPAAPLAQHETVYLHFLPGNLPLDTRGRTFQSRMRPFAFTGKLALTRLSYGGNFEAAQETIEADYLDGRLQSFTSIGGAASLGVGGTGTLTWSGDNLTAYRWVHPNNARIEAATVDSRGGHIRSFREPTADGIHTIDFTYDAAGNFLGYREQYPASGSDPATTFTLAVTTCP